MFVLLLAGCTASEDAPAPPVDPKGEGVLSWGEYMEAPEGESVLIETYVQAAEVWWNGTVSVYTQDRDGAYFLRDAACSMAEAEQLFPGTKLRVTGTKTTQSGMPMVENAQFELLLPPGADAASQFEAAYGESSAVQAKPPAGSAEAGSAASAAPDPAYFYIAAPVDITELAAPSLETAQSPLAGPSWETLSPYLGAYAALRGVTVSSAVRYKEDGSGAEGNDLFFEGTIGEDGRAVSLRFQVCSYLTGAGTDVYRAAEDLQPGDIIDLKGFCFWDDGFVLRVTAIEASE